MTYVTGHRRPSLHRWLALASCTVLMAATGALATPGVASAGPTPVSGQRASDTKPSTQGRDSDRPFKAYGRTHAPDRTLKKGCKNYNYHYALKPPTSTWGLETFLIAPNGETLASGFLLSNSDPVKGKAAFRVCKVNTRSGRFLIRGKLTYKVDYQSYSGMIKQSGFRLRSAH